MHYLVKAANRKLNDSEGVVKIDAVKETKHIVNRVVNSSRSYRQVKIHFVE